ncbi:hypothetical protein K7432_010625 [Basidiobolus ranarum]|uniref:Uncharacterized protein n=1 Tax=Basidiobolus ranarum TaxID=34480 RepID=A0ABR2WNF6_9FUNG
MRFLLLVPLLAAAVAFPAEDSTNVNLKKRALTCSGATYDVPAFSTCIENCNMKAGLLFYNDFSKDPTSPGFIKSLSYECDSANPDRTSFMTKAGICMVGCTTAEQDGYTNGYKAMCGWYTEHKNDVCTPAVSSTSVIPEPTTSSIPETPSPSAIESVTPSITVTSSSASVTDSSSASEVVPTSPPTSVSVTPTASPIPPSGKCVTYDGPVPAPCIQGCLLVSGRKLWNRYIWKPTSENFIPSLGYECDSSNPNHEEFLRNSASCVQSCTSYPDYQSKQGPICSWYEANKANTICTAPVPTVTPTTTVSETPSPTCQPFRAPDRGQCINNCNDQAGKTFFGDYSQDPQNASFMKSLSLECDSEDSSHTSFMIKAGTCMVGCSTEEQGKYTDGYRAVCNWYTANKQGGFCNPSATSVSSSVVQTPTSIPTNSPSASVSISSTISSTGPTPTCVASAPYTGPLFGSCINNCNEQAGKVLFGDFSKDPTSPNLIKSLSFECDSTNPQRTAFMTKAGICMVGCTTAEQDTYTNGYKAMCNWYQEHKNDTPGNCPGENTTSVSSSLPTTIPTSVVPTISASVTTSPSVTASPAPSSTCTPGGGPSYNGPTFSACIDNCNEQAGKALFSDFSKNPNSPNLIKSLSFECDPTNPQRTTFMTKAGICMVGCTTAEQDVYTNGYKAMCNWYEQNKNGSPNTCTGENTSSVIVIPTTVVPSNTIVPTGSATASPAPSGTCTPGAAPAYTGPTFSTCINSCNDVC